MSNPILEISDGTTTISLIQPSRFKLRGWTPLRPGLKGGGVWRGSPLSDGHEIVSAQYHNTVDTFDLIANDGCQDELIELRQDLDRLLTKAREYWTTDWTTEPVWLHAKGPDETNDRYAVIHSYEMLMDDNPYSQPFYSIDTAMDDLTLAIEHGFWQAEVPGTAVCVEASGGMTTEFDGIFYPTQSEDDARVGSAGGIDVANAWLYVGASGQIYSSGVRFRTVTVPPGATITSAFIRYTSTHALATVVCRAKLIGELNVTPAIFTTYVDFVGRAQTAASEPWAPGAFVVGNQYDTPDISDVIQEIVDLPGWVVGNNLVVFTEDNASDAGAYRGMAQWDNGTYAEAELHLTWTLLTGRTPTCEREVYVANKHNLAQITNVYTWTDPAGPFSANLIGGVMPQDLFDGGAAGPANGDITYFGCDTTLANSGPFCSLVFDVLTAATYGAGDLVTWQYWNGGWVNLTVYDNTANPSVYSATTTPWEETGVNSINWEQPSDWLPTAIHLVTAYWVRCVVTEATAITRARQQNRDIYTVTWGGVTISPTTLAGDEQLYGDLPLLLKLTQQSCFFDLTTRRCLIDGIWWGLRSKWRGPDFQAYLNFADEQNPADVTAVVGALGAFATNTMTSTGRCLRWTAPGIAIMQQGGRIEIGGSVSKQYQGIFHVFLRYWSSTGANGDVRGYVRFMLPVGIQVTTDTFEINVASDWIAQDLGVIRIPTGPMLDPSDFLGAVDIQVHLQNTIAAARTVDLMDIVLIPADEWLIKVESSIAGLLTEHEITIDSATRPKDMTTWERDPSANYQVWEIWRPYAAGPAMLQRADKDWAYDQVLWTFMQSYHDGVDTIYGPYFPLRVELDAVHRYLSMRGAR